MDYKEVLKTIAPWIGTALGGPLGGFAVEVATNALGLSEKTTTGLKQALQGLSPEMILTLKQADQSFAIHMQEIGFKQLSDMEALAVADRKDARALLTSTRSNIPAALSVFVTTGYFAILVGILTGHMETNNSEAMLLMLGSLTTAWGVVMAFWFGTTSGSSRKTELIANSTQIDTK